MDHAHDASDALAPSQLYIYLPPAHGTWPGEHIEASADAWPLQHSQYRHCIPCKGTPAFQWCVCIYRNLKD